MTDELKKEKDPLVEAFNMTLDHATMNDQALLNLCQAIIETVNFLQERMNAVEMHVMTLNKNLLELTTILGPTDKGVH